MLLHSGNNRGLCIYVLSLFDPALSSLSGWKRIRTIETMESSKPWALDSAHYVSSINHAQSHCGLQNRTNFSEFKISANQDVRLNNSV